MKIAISGKGGVGKTTVAGGLIHLLADKGIKVLAIDADPDANLASALGFSKDEVERAKPLSSLKELIAERTGVQPGTTGGFFKLNPRVDDIPERFSASRGNIRLLRLGTVEQGGSGCICPESTLLRSLMHHLLLERGEAVVMDMEAGIEHLGRGTAESVDALLIVIEPGRRSIQTAEAVNKLAMDIGIKNIFLVLCKVRDDAEELSLRKQLPDLPVLGVIHEHESIRASDLSGGSAYETDADFRAEIEAIYWKLAECRE